MTQYGKFQTDQDMPGAELSHTVASRELVRQVPTNQRIPAADYLKGAAPNPSEERMGL